MSNEKIYFIDGDANEYLLHDDSSKMVTSLAGVGAPDIELYSQKTPFQHGAQFLGYNWQPRKVIVGIYRYPTNRNALYEDHETLLSAIRPDRGEGTLKWVLNDGTVRQLDVYFSGGLKYDTKDQVAFKHQVDVLELTAFSPFWYNPTTNSTGYVMLTTSDSFFPFLFPFSLSASGISVSSSITNNGQVDAYPTLTITGPGDNPEIFNVTTGKRLSLTYTIPAGQTIVVDSNIGEKTVIYDNGVSETNVIGYLSSDSEFFPVQPGANTIRCSMNNTTASSGVVIAFSDQYLGV